MGLLRKVGGSALRGSGRFLAVHVVPDTLLPSWKTQKRVAALGRALKPKKKKKKAPAQKKEYKSPALAGVRPARSGKPSASKKPKPTFNKNAWSQGRAMSVSGSFSPSASTSPRAASSARPSFAARLGSQFRPSTVARRKQKLRDIKNEPRLFIQMHADELFHNVRSIKMPFKSKNPY